MNNTGFINNFSKKTRQEKITLAAEYTGNPVEFERCLREHLHSDPMVQALYNEFTENAVSNFYLPFSVVPNFLVNDRYYMVPMVTDESSVIAAAARAAKFWSQHGGFRTRIISTNKTGHIHFLWKGSREQLSGFVSAIRPGLYNAVSSLTENMTGRGGGILDIRLNDLSEKMENYHQLEVIFNTVDSMGANFINSCLEVMNGYFLYQAADHGMADDLEIIMSVLSNYSPECLIECSVSCPVGELAKEDERIRGHEVARRFEIAVNMAQHDVYRAVTHNKGIYNGVDAVIMATGNDSRAVSAAGHSFAARDGSYKGLTHASVDGKNFIYQLRLPLPLGTVGGITTVHPMAKMSMSLLQNPDAAELMAVVAATGLASNFSAVRALVTSGIQQGHMRLHLTNLLRQLDASEPERISAIEFFSERRVTNTGVVNFLASLRKKNN
jgi:hydroxymethylglutaryl-CoA reductase